MKKLGLGMMRLPVFDEDNFESINQEKINEMVDYFMKKGFNYFDTGYSYHGGLSETAIKKALVERYPRSSFIIADKFPTYAVDSEDQFETIFNEQLKRCGVDYFDYYMMHNVSAYSKKGWMDVDSFSFVREKKEEGYIKKFGLSSHANAEFLDNVLNSNPDIEYVLLQVNYLDWENDGVEAKKCCEVARKHNLPVFVMEPLKGGFLADVPEEVEKLMRTYNPDDSPVKWALRYVLSIPDVELLLTGSSSLEQLKENIEIFNDFKPLNDEEYGIIDKAIEIINSNISVDCTKCNYCIEACPEDINIPKFLDLYNSEMIQGLREFSAFGNAYSNYSKIPDAAIASDCNECGSCIDKCPQHINISEELKNVAKTFETEGYGF